MSEKVVVHGGMGLLGWLTVLLVGLKLTNVITWPWWQVLVAVLLPLSVVTVTLFAIIVIDVIVKATK